MNGAAQKVGAVVGAIALTGLVAMAVSKARNAEAAAVPEASSAAAPNVPAAAPAPGSLAAAPAATGGDKAHVTFFKNTKPLPAFDITTIDGKHLTQASLKGKVAIIDFWATWCGPCREEIPSFIDLAKKYSDKLVVLGLSVDDDPHAGDLVRKFVAEHAVSYPVAMASDKLQGDFGGTPTLPLTFVVSPDGRIMQKHVGTFGEDEFEMEVRALAGLPVDAVVDYADDPDQAAVDRAFASNTLPGVDLGGLTTEQRKTVIKRLNNEKCTCGCGRTVALCRVTDPSCETSLPLAKKIVEEVRAGKASGG